MLIVYIVYEYVGVFICSKINESLEINCLRRFDSLQLPADF